MAAWVLLIAFIGALGLKSLHIHDLNTSECKQTTHQHQTVVKSVCYVCDFVFHKVEEAKNFAYNPIIYVTINQPYFFKTLLVYRCVESINSHSPPFSLV